MALHIPAGHGVTAEEMVETGGFISAAGYGHFYLEDQAEREKCIELRFVCLAHEAEQNVEKRYTERLWFVAANENTDQKELWKRILYWAWKLGVVSEAEVASGEALEIDFAPSVEVGAQCVLHIKSEEYDSKKNPGKKGTSYKADYKGIFFVTDPIVADKKVPLSMDAIEQAGIELPDAVAAPVAPPPKAAPKAAPVAAKTTTAAAGKPPAKPPVKKAAAPANDDLGDI